MSARQPRSYKTRTHRGIFRGIFGRCCVGGHTQLARIRTALALTLLLATAGYAPQASAFCWKEAGERYQISAVVLQSIGQHESGLKATAVNRNENGTVDVGVMQINSMHFAELRSYGIAPNALWDPCMNVMVGAFLLAKSIRKYGNTWEAVGAYHSRTPGLKERYALQVYGVFSRQEQQTRAPVRPRAISR